MIEKVSWGGPLPVHSGNFKRTKLKVIAQTETPHLLKKQPNERKENLT